MGNNFFTNIDIFEEYIANNNVLFHRFDTHKNGIDGIVEVIKDEKTTNHQFGISILEIEEHKQDKNFVTVDITKNKEYFKSFDLPIILIVMSNKSEEGFWIDITKLKDSMSSEIVIPKQAKHVFNKTTSSKILIDYFVNNRSKYLEIVKALDSIYFKCLRSLLEDMFGVIDIAIPSILKYENLESLLEEESFTLHLKQSTGNKYNDVMRIKKSKEYIQAENLPPISKTESVINLNGNSPFYFKTKSNHIFTTKDNYKLYCKWYRILKFRFD
ncbi:DUF4365 domain-containing protein [Halosquirtibacter laminarini]|uniref:DUF4365 domain-containing protein n=1 Tax=Halosquirtibacter laminarini TaxID=3374600 RepID=A0AC61NII5_9BACT|nr:DUF4365 domain-containing protein [Prolixibacteraceae bacterium]